MRKFIPKTRTVFSTPIRAVGYGLALSFLTLVANAQTPAEPAPSSSDSHWAVAPYNASSEQKDPILKAGPFSLQTTGGEIKEDQLKQLLVGKTLYLRSGYQDNNLEFDESGRLTSHSPQGSFTLSEIQINKIKLSKHKLELQGDRYGLHFLGAAPYEDPTKATDRVKITPKKKSVRISFDREQVEKPKKEKHKRSHKGDFENQSSERRSLTGEAPQSTPVHDDSQSITFDRPTRKGDKEVTRTTSPAHASQLLISALDNVFSVGIDDRMIANMPPFWRLYYQAAASKAEIKSSRTDVQSQRTIDQKARLISVIDPPSNEFAQANGVAGMALYHAVIGVDGKVEEVVASRPIGFGLDENADRAIRAATFQPAMKDGKPVPVSLDLVVSFRIYSKRTSQPGVRQDASGNPISPALPGPYTLQTIAAQQQPTPPDAQSDTASEAQSAPQSQPSPQ